MKVLSLFDGMSCGRIAFDRAGIPVEKYYASEIDKYAQIVSTANYPDIARLGDVTKWSEWRIEQPDIIIGGSPCQGFSFAGKRLNFEDPRSKLFFVFADILRHYKPKYFLLENVVMDKRSEYVISEILGYIYKEDAIETLFSHIIEPIKINSALVSAQNRKRLYLTNIPGVTQPEDKGILLKDIIEHGEVDREKSYCIDANYYKGGSEKNYKEKARRQLVIVKQLPHGRNKGFLKACDKMPSMTKSSWQDNNLISFDGKLWRKLTPIECERLQTVPDNYTAHVSNSQRYKMLGNGWTVDVIAHIFKGLSDAK